MAYKDFDLPIYDDSIADSPIDLEGRSRKGGRRTAISLFSGGGGLDIGVEQAGFQPLCCIEIDQHCCKTLENNQPRYLSSAKIMQSDVRHVLPGTLKRSLGLAKGELDLLYGGPPCQAFSQIGKQDGLSDDRGMLLFEVIRYAKSFQPKAILIENVKALVNAKDLHGKRGGVLAKLLYKLQKLGYEPHVKILNAADYGVAQLRERLFVVAVKYDIPFDFPEPSNGPGKAKEYVTVGQVLRGLPKPLGKDRRNEEENHTDVTPDGDKKRISYVEEGSYLAASCAPAKIKGRLTRKDTTKFLRLSRIGQSKTLRCGEIFFHPVEDRYLTPREYMRIHGFPDDYVLRGPIRGRSGSVKNLDQHRQIANSVPPPMARAVALKIKAALVEAGENG